MKNLTNKYHYTLNDLNNLENSLGHKIYELIESGANGNSVFLKSSEEISRLLRERGISEEEVFIEKGLASGLILKEALENASKSYCFMDKLNESVY